MNIKYFKLATFIYYSPLIGLLVAGDFAWSGFFKDLSGLEYLNRFGDVIVQHNPDTQLVFALFIFPAIVIWGTYFILKK